MKRLETRWFVANLGIFLFLLISTSSYSHGRGECFFKEQNEDIGQPGMQGGKVHELVEHKGEVFAVGEFLQAGGETVNFIARWDGENWHGLGKCPGTWHNGCGVNGHAFSITDYGGGLAVGGWFDVAGGQTANYVALWKDQSWESLGDGMGPLWNFDTRVHALVEYQGDLVAGGGFITADNEVVNRIALWDGKSWKPLAEGMDHNVHSLVVYDGDLIAGGKFQNAGGTEVNYVARWDGKEWKPLGEGLNGFVWSLAVYGEDLIAGGSFTKTGDQKLPLDFIARWNGTNWQPLAGGGLDNSVRSIAVFQGSLVVGGDFWTAGDHNQEVGRVARWDGANWHALSGKCLKPPFFECGADGPVYALLPTCANTLVLGGSFVSVDGQEANYVAEWTCSKGVLGDLNGDGMVDQKDLAILLSQWGNCLDCCNCLADLNGDCQVDALDLLLILQNWTV